ncbi:hypothetical protein MTR_6g006760 [Medicago truncatula]|uniref:Uncharacterized protein n=1 Tax=Medicago truncatula TaxID=3880 RepID=G7KI78_MEDTR|nr:hypothetical protein MTR_6g006760 [Medicago truncatula]
MELEEDHLSCLPKIILHCILSKLSEKDGARTSVLSKAWLVTWYTFPILYFHSNQIIGMSPPPMEDSVRKRKILEFGNYVKRRMLMFRDQSLPIKEFKIDLNGFVPKYMSKDVDIWLKLACECGVEEALDLVALQVSSSPPRIKHLVINYVPLKEYLFSSHVIILLASCCPATISFSCAKAFIKFFYETLMRKKKNDCFCSSDDTKCWWHDLKDVKVTSTMKIDENVDFKTPLWNRWKLVYKFLYLKKV